MIRKKHVIVALQGGLGDQIYQYCFGKFLRDKFNFKLILDLSFYKSNQNKKKYKLELNDLIKKDKILVKKKVFLFGYFFLSKLRFINFLNKNIQIFIYKLLFKIKVDYFFYEKIYNFKKFNSNIINSPYTFYSGYWHFKETVLLNKKSIDSILIKKSIRKRKISKFIKDKIGKNVVMIHIRGGDYLEKKYQQHYVCNLDYYKKGILKIEKKIKNPEYHIFTNDILYAKEIVRNLRLKKTFYVNDLRLKNVEEFSLQTCYRTALINNSNFSYLPSLLSKKRQLTISPKYLFKNILYPKQLVLDNFYLI